MVSFLERAKDWLENPWSIQDIVRAVTEDPAVKTGDALAEQQAAAQEGNPDFSVAHNANASPVENFRTIITTEDLDELDPLEIANFQTFAGLEANGKLTAQTADAIADRLEDPTLLTGDEPGADGRDITLADIGQPSPYILEQLRELGQTAPVEELIAGGTVEDPNPVDPDVELVAKSMREPGSVPVAKVQEALGRMGFDPGTADGIRGPRTNDAELAAIKKHPELQVAAVEGYKPGDSSDPYNTQRMQAAVGTTIDGSPGPNTAQALADFKSATPGLRLGEPAGQLIAQHVKPDTSGTQVAGGLQAKDPATSGFNTAAPGVQVAAADAAQDLAQKTGMDAADIKSRANLSIT